MYRSCTGNAGQMTAGLRARNLGVMGLAARGAAARLDRPAFSPLGQKYAGKSPRVPKQHKSLWVQHKRHGDLADCSAPQVGLELWFLGFRQCPTEIQLLNKINKINSDKVRRIPPQAVIFCWPYCWLYYILLKARTRI